MKWSDVYCYKCGISIFFSPLREGLYSLPPIRLAIKAAWILCENPLNWCALCALFCQGGLTPLHCLESFLGVLKYLNRQQNVAWFYCECYSFGKFFLKMHLLESHWQWKNLSFYLYFLKQVSGLHKEKLEKVIHRAQKSDTKDPKEKYVCVWSYIYDIFFIALAVFTCSLSWLAYHPTAHVHDAWQYHKGKSDTVLQPGLSYSGPKRWCCCLNES